MKTIGVIGKSLTIGFLFTVNSFAQPVPPGAGGCTNCPPYTNNYTPPPYIPGLKLSIPPLSGTNLPINLLEADPSGKYDIYSASNLTFASWHDLVQGTNGQTNFILSFPQSDMGFFRAARTDTPITNAANVTATFPNTVVNTNLITALVSNGPAAAMAILVNSTNFSSAQWIPFSAVPYVLLGTNDGVYQVWFGFRGSDGTDYWSMLTVTLDTIPPTIVITNPIGSIVSRPMIQLQGYSTKVLGHLTFDVSNFAGTATNQQGFVTDQFFDTNTWKFTTNYFQCYDIGLVQGTNSITVHATDLAGNTTTINASLTLDYSAATNPVINIYWPQDNTAIVGTSFTWRGWVDDAMAQVTAQIVNTGGVTNVVQGIVERDGKFWVENLPLSSGANWLALTVTNSTGFSSETNIIVVKSGLNLTIDPVNDDLWLPTVTVSGTLDDTNYTVWVNGVKAANNGDGTWQIANVPLPQGGTAVIQARAIPNSDNGGNGSGGSDSLGNPDSDQNNDVESDIDKPAEVKLESAKWASETYCADFTDGNPPPWILNQTQGNWIAQEGGTLIEHYEGQDSNQVTQATSDTTKILTPIPSIIAVHFTNSVGWFSDDSYIYGADGLPIGEHLYGLWSDGEFDFYLTNSYSLDLGPISIAQEIGSAGIQDNLGESYTEASQVKLVLHTGGKSIVGSQNLWLISGSASGLMLYFVGVDQTNSITPQSIAIGNLGNLDTNGNLAVVLPDDAEVDVTPRANASFYTFNISATKYTPGPCTVSVQAIQNAAEPGCIPNSMDCSVENDICFGQTGYVEFTRSGDTQRPLWVRYGVSGTANMGYQYYLFMDFQYNCVGDFAYGSGNLITEQTYIYFAPGVTNVIEPVYPKYYGSDYGTVTVEFVIEPDGPGLEYRNSPPYYTVDQANATATVYVTDSDVDAWTPQYKFVPGLPVPTNGVIEISGNLHREDYDPNTGIGSEVGFGPAKVMFYLVTEAELGIDFTLQSSNGVVYGVGCPANSVFNSIQIINEQGKVETLQVYTIIQSFCIGWSDADGTIHSPISVTTPTSTLTVLPHDGTGQTTLRRFWVMEDDPRFEYLFCWWPSPPSIDNIQGDLLLIQN